ncbi:hypothetical protein A3842_26955 [Paenibacillus sp. P3E]|nr:hypothetical protein [Paenibacillus sp. P3E]OKP68351.1 hypothetical protein A3842_26955 [Paenibacillus sp. P3E]
MNCGKIKENKHGSPDNGDVPHNSFQRKLICQESAKTAETNIDKRIYAKNITCIQERKVLLIRQKDRQKRSAHKKCCSRKKGSYEDIPNFAVQVPRYVHSYSLPSLPMYVHCVECSIQ